MLYQGDRPLYTTPFAPSKWIGPLASKGACWSWFLAILETTQATFPSTMRPNVPEKQALESIPFRLRKNLFFPGVPENMLWKPLANSPNILAVGSFCLHPRKTCQKLSRFFADILQTAIRVLILILPPTPPYTHKAETISRTL